MLVPQQPIGRLVTKGQTGALEYDPSDAPEFIADEFGSGVFSWDPLTPEGGLLEPGEYAEQSIPVPEDRLDYLRGAGWLEGKEDEDCRAYVEDETLLAHGREWRQVTLRGSRDAVQQRAMQVMAGVLRQRPWDPPAPTLTA